MSKVEIGLWNRVRLLEDAAGRRGAFRAARPEASVTGRPAYAR